MQRAKSPVILIEFNELTPSLMERFMASAHLPNFQRLYNESHVYETDAEEEGENLNPWVQWVTVHSGLSASEHGVTRLADGHRLQTKAVWDVLSEAGYRVWVCGSMNARYDRPLNGMLLPDPWSTGLTPYPKRVFDPYYNFVQYVVQEHTNPGAPLSKSDACKFLWFMLTHGLSPSTIRAVIAQLAGERRHHDSWKRAVILDLFQWDVFHHYYRNGQVDFATFFLNSTAHFQHAYWRQMEPERFSVKPSEEEVEQYGCAILYGYQTMDKLIGRFLKLAGQDATLIFCTGLSQQPYLKAESTGGRHYYRIIGPHVFSGLLGIESRFEYNPVMSDQAILRFEGEDEASQAEDRLRSFRLTEGPVFHTSRDWADLMVQCNCTGIVAPEAVMAQESGSPMVPFFHVFYSMDVVKSGFHHPDGMLWVRYPGRSHVMHEGKVSLRSIAPSILELLGVPCSDFMTCEPFLQNLLQKPICN
jgi:predicted AlkP superfamily phosphohydrolase/phosphomutase